MKFLNKIYVLLNNLFCFVKRIHIKILVLVCLLFSIKCNKDNKLLMNKLFIEKLKAENKEDSIKNLLCYGYLKRYNRNFPNVIKNLITLYVIYYSNIEIEENIIN